MINNHPDKIIFGHNQFFGINHLSAARGLETEEFFQKTKKIVDLIDFAYRKGAHGLMLSTHEKAVDIATEIARRPVLRKNLRVYILLPYVAKYVKKANERGMVNMVFELLKSGGLSRSLQIGLKGGIGVITKDPYVLLKTLIDLELLPFKKLNLNAVFLHNSLTDLTAGLKLESIFPFFADYISKKYDVLPGFCTLTSGLSMKFIDECGIKNPLIMAPFNPAGFQMSPSQSACVKALNSYPARVVAMSVLAAGYNDPQSAARYIKSLPSVRSVIFGSSNPGHIEKNIALFKSALASK